MPSACSTTPPRRCSTTATCLQIALDQMEQGITVFDRDFRLICWNRQYRALFDLPDEMGQVGVSLDRILRHLAERGDIPATSAWRCSTG